MHINITNMLLYNFKTIESDLSTLCGDNSSITSGKWSLKIHVFFYTIAIDISL